MENGKKQIYPVKSAEGGAKQFNGVKKEEECPLCKISLETLEKLKKSGEQKNKNRSEINKKK